MSSIPVFIIIVKKSYIYIGKPEYVNYYMHTGNKQLLNYRKPLPEQLCAQHNHLYSGMIRPDKTVVKTDIHTKEKWGLVWRIPTYDPGEGMNWK